MITGEEEVRRRQACPHDVNELLKKEREFMPMPWSEHNALVWCQDCLVWIPFEWEGAT